MQILLGTRINYDLHQLISKPIITYSKLGNNTHHKGILYFIEPQSSVR